MIADGPHRNSGFTLIEIVIGMVIFGIGLVIITNLLVPQANRSIDPVYQVRATELAQSMLDEISGKSFDENADRAGEHWQCGSAGTASCTAPEKLGPEGETRNQFDDVDDYNHLQVIEDSRGTDLSNPYRGFRLAVQVHYVTDMQGQASIVNSVTDIKLIQVEVTTPNGQVLQFATYRTNF